VLHVGLRLVRLAATELVVGILGQVTGGFAIAQGDDAIRTGTIQRGVGAVQHLVAGIGGDVDGMAALAVRLRLSMLTRLSRLLLHFRLREAEAGGGVGHPGAVGVLGARLAGLHGQLGAVSDAGVALQAVIVASCGS